MYTVAFLDTETTGLDPETDQIISYCVTIWRADESGIHLGGSCSRRVLPTVPVSPEAQRVNRYDEAEWLSSGAKPWDQEDCSFIWGILSQCGKRPVVGGHNVAFDIGFLKSHFARCNFTFEISHRTVDTCALAQPLVALGLIPNASLEALRAYFALDDRHAHTAIGDTHNCVEAWEKFLEIYAGQLCVT
jgi:DNA polymerase III epsilon subunit-like protein